MRPGLLTMLCLLAALACYAVGFVLPASAMLVLGGLLELAFWVRLLRRQTNDTADSGVN